MKKVESRTWKRVIIHSIAFLTFVSLFHELAHAIVGTAFGWKVKDIMFTPFLRWVSFEPLQHYPSLIERIAIYGSGTVVSIVIYLCLLNEIKHDAQLFSIHERWFIYVGLIWRIIYGIYETVFLGIIYWL